MKKNSAISGILQPTELHELYEGRSSQLYAQLMQLRKESLKKKIQACLGFEPLTSAIPVQRSTN